MKALPKHTLSTLYTRSASWFLAAFVLVGINGCANQPVNDMGHKIKTGAQKLVQKLPSYNVNRSSKEQLSDEIEFAQSLGDWQSYIEKTEQLWQMTPQAEQFLLESTSWQTLNNLTDTQWQTLREMPSEPVQSWVALYDITRLPNPWQKAYLKDLAEFEPDTSFSHHLIGHLLELLSTPEQVKQIAILLPFTGPYEDIATQIRNGIIRNHLKSNSQAALRFYNVTDTQYIVSTFQSAIDEGAEVVIGPLTKPAIATLSGAMDTLADTYKKVPVIALNQVARTPFKMFNFKSEAEAQQITQQLCQQSYKHIGILSSTNSANAELATQIQQNWQQNPFNQATLKTYPSRNPNLRKALGSVINEDTSQARNNNLSWLLNRNLDFTPRTRQDLEAIVLVGNATNLAVFKPQFKFFNLKLPLYGTANLTPKQFNTNNLEPDLANIRFPTFPAALKPSAVKTAFEAYGWDAYLLASEPSQFASGLCNHRGMTGGLTETEQGYDRYLQWAKYSQNGQIRALSPKD